MSSKKENKANPLAAQMARDAAERLHHLSMRYVGALAEVGQGKPVGLIPKDHPGIKEMRDIIDLVLITRAEINALSRLLLDKKVFTADEFNNQVTEEYEWLAQQKARLLGVEIIEGGLSFKTGD